MKVSFNVTFTNEAFNPYCTVHMPTLENNHNRKLRIPNVKACSSHECIYRMHLLTSIA